MFRAITTAQPGKERGAQESSLPWLELQGKLRLGPGSPGSESSADSLCRRGLALPLPQPACAVSVMIRWGLPVEQHCEGYSTNTGPKPEGPEGGPSGEDS